MSLCLSPNSADNGLIFKHFAEVPGVLLLLLKVAVNTIVPRSPFFLFLYLKTRTVTHIRKNAVEYLRQ